MKKIFGCLIFGISSILFFNGCKEIGPPIILNAPPKAPQGTKPVGLLKDSSYVETTIPTADAKRVMIEEFSGQHCPNCPTGHAAVQQIIATNPGKVSAATLHTNIFAPQSDPIYPVDFRTTFATDILNTYGAGGVGIPCAMIDRTLFSGQTSLPILTPSTWANYVTQELTKTSYVNIVLNSNWNAAINQDSITVELHFTANASADSLNFSLMITEDSIIAGQEDPSNNIVPNYVHNDILRTMVTGSSGMKIAATKTPGRVVIYKFWTQIIDATKWNVDKLKVIAFVHKQNTSNYEIVQAAEKKLK